MTLSHLNTLYLLSPLWPSAQLKEDPACLFLFSPNSHFYSATEQSYFRWWLPPFKRMILISCRELINYISDSDMSWGLKKESLSWQCICVLSQCSILQNMERQNMPLIFIESVLFLQKEKESLLPFISGNGKTMEQQETFNTGMVVSYANRFSPHTRAAVRHP